MSFFGMLTVNSMQKLMVGSKTLRTIYGSPAATNVVRVVASEARNLRHASTALCQGLKDGRGGSRAQVEAGLPPMIDVADLAKRLKNKKIRKNTCEGVFILDVPAMCTNPAGEPYSKDFLSFIPLRRYIQNQRTFKKLQKFT